MLIGEPMPSPYDWRFRFLGFNIRVTWLFWLVNAAFGYEFANQIDRAFRIPGLSSPGAPTILIFWVLAVFLSVLIHELGHSLAFRFFGIDSEIVLYHMGGMAIPTAGYLFYKGGTRRSLTHRDQLIISAAGPGLQFLAGLIVIAFTLFAQWRIPTVMAATSWLGIDTSSFDTPHNAIVFSSLWFFIMISVWWPLFNLLPVYPLDGGQIAQHLFAIFRRTDGRYEAHLLGAIAGFLMAWWFFKGNMTINAMLFASMAVSNVQALQQYRGPRIW